MTMTDLLIPAGAERDNVRSLELAGRLGVRNDATAVRTLFRRTWTDRLLRRG